MALHGGPGCSAMNNQTTGPATFQQYINRPLHAGRELYLLHFTKAAMLMPSYRFPSP